MISACSSLGFIFISLFLSAPLSQALDRIPRKAPVYTAETLCALSISLGNAHGAVLIDTG